MEKDVVPMDEIKSPLPPKKKLDLQMERKLLVAGFYLAMLILLAIFFVPEQTSWEIGKVATADVQADRYLTFEDEAATKQKQDEALKGFIDIYKLDLSQYNNLTLVALDNYFAILEEYILAPNDPELMQEEAEAKKIAKLKEELDLEFTPAEWSQIVHKTQAEFTLMHNQAVAITTQVMGKGVREENLQAAHTAILDEVRSSKVVTGSNEALLLAILAKLPYYGTSVYDQVASEAAKAEIIARVEPVSRVVQKGESVVSRGDVLTAEQYEILYWLGHTSEMSPWLVVLGLGVVLAVMLYVSWIYFMRFYPKLLTNLNYLRLVLLVVLFAFITYPIVLAIDIGSTPNVSGQIGYLVPAAATAMLLSVLLNARIALYVHMILTCFVGLYTDQVAFAIVALLGGLVGIAQTSMIVQRSDLSWTMVTISLVNGITIIGLGLFAGASVRAILAGVAFGVGNGFLSAILTLGLMPYLEAGFGLTTPMRLLELSNPNQPLLRKLLEEAPGTYHHAIMVGNLGEAAAEAIGANSLVVRVGAYYHDIGKTKRPAFFSENQFTDVNPHDKISPTLSALILQGHIKDGLEMGREAKLPPIVLDMIAQHHGNSVIKFFYYKAKELDDETRIEDFRYDQKKPQSREAAVLMMADTVEAAVRSKKNATSGEIEGFIRALIKDKFNDGQLDECELNFRDLETIAQAFTRVLTGMYHKRIVYPDQDAMLKQKQKRKGELKHAHHSE